MKRMHEVHAWAYLAIAIAFAVMLAAGLHANTPAWAQVLFCAGVLGLVVTTLARRLRQTVKLRRARRVRASHILASELDVALALVVGCYTLIAQTGGVDSPVQPLSYLLVAFMVSFQPALAAGIALTAMLTIEVAWLYAAAGERDVTLLVVTRIALLLLAASSHWLFLRAAALYWRQRAQTEVAESLRQHRENARDFRVMATATASGAITTLPRREAHARLSDASGYVMDVAIDHILHSLHMASRAQTATLLWLHGGEQVRVKAMVSTLSDDELALPRECLPLVGPLGAVVRERDAIELRNSKPGQLPYYRDGRSAALACIVPIVEGHHVRGMLCCDAPGEMPNVRSLAELAAQQILQTMENEAVLTGVERAKYEYERFFHASSMLGEALTVDNVVHSAFAAARQIVDIDVAALATYDAARKRHRVYAVDVAPGAEDVLTASTWQQLECSDNSGLASMVIKNRHFLPAGGDCRETSVQVFTRTAKLQGVQSLMVLPLFSGDEALGTLILASRAPKRFREDVRNMLLVIARQVATSLHNALLFSTMETMATTDGLTGLTNRRTFQSRFSDLLHRAERHDRHVALLLCDVDFFKKVNDNYGHPVGDEVLRLVAKVLQAAVRKIDITARYGGEEFAVVLDGTDADGALQLAERIRADVGALVIETEKGSLRVTASLGVAVFPSDGETIDELIHRADIALYRAKETGRNRVVAFRNATQQNRAAS